MGDLVAAYRIDAGVLQAPRRTSQGFLRADGRASRVGVLEYRDANGKIRRELRLPDAVFDHDSLAGFEGAPVTDDHPSEMLDLNNARSYTRGVVLGAGRRDGDHVAVSIVVQDPELIRKMEKGKRQLSVGYGVQLDETPGVHPTYGPYDAIQRKIGPINHLAVVDRGRAGANAAVRMDALAQVSPAGDDPDSSAAPVATCVPVPGALTNATGMPEVENESEDGKLTAQQRGKISTEHFAIPSRKALPIEDEGHLRAAMARFNQTDFANAAERTSAFHRVLARAHELGVDASQFQKEHGGKSDSAEINPMDETQKKLDAALAEIDALKKKATETEGALLNARKDAEAAEQALDAAKTTHAAQLAAKDAEREQAVATQRKDSVDQVAAQVRQRVALETKATGILGADAKFGADQKAIADAPDADIKLAVIKRVDGDDDVKAEHVDALYEGAVRRHEKVATSRADARSTIAANRQDAATKSVPVTGAALEQAASNDLASRVSSAWMTK